MERILTTLLILVFLASVTICGCGHEARAESHAASHHHDRDGDHSFKHDCKTADMQLPQQANISKPGKVGFSYDHIFVTDVVTPPIILIGSHEIRGPPPDWPDTSHTQPAILLVTQRLLI